MVEFKRAIKAARLLSGKTQTEAAEQIGVSVVTLCRWENGATQPVAEQLIRMGNVYNVPLDRLCGLS